MFIRPCDTRRKLLSVFAPFARPLLIGVSFAGLIILSMQAQAGKGTITGSVTDPAQGALQGARIEVEGTGLTAVSDAQGLFMIVEVPEGKRTVKVSYVGFSD